MIDEERALAAHALGHAVAAAGMPTVDICYDVRVGRYAGIHVTPARGHWHELAVVLYAGPLAEYRWRGGPAQKTSICTSPDWDAINWLPLGYDQHQQAKSEASRVLDTHWRMIADSVPQITRRGYVDGHALYDLTR